MEFQICKVCNKNKPLTKEYFDLGKNKRDGIEITYWYKTCKECDRPRILAKIQRYKNKNRKVLAEKQKEYHQLNKENDSETKKKWYENNKDIVKLRVKKWMRNKRKNDPVFRLKQAVSAQIRLAIKKNNLSFLKFVPYTLDELKDHIEMQFEEWMTWQNYGTYRCDKWDDNDQSTWTWQLDHIIPHSTFNYTSMKDDEFKKCWSLNNLRPLSAKQNIIDGNRR